MAAKKSAKSRAKPKQDLRRRILETSLALVEREGVEHLSMREVARRLGVTHQAPYHHFDGRGAILQALVDEGFEVLGRDSHEAMRGADGPLAAFRATGHAYIDFALRHPGHFKLMFRPELVGEQRASTVGADAFQALVECVVACQAAGYLAEGDPMPTVLLAWSIVHGAASLTLDGPLPAMPFLPTARSVVDTFVSVLTRPLSARPSSVD